MRTLPFVLASILLLVHDCAVADGLRMHLGRSDAGPVSVFRLTEAQVLKAERIARCHSDNTRTPYIFELAEDQRVRLLKEAGTSVSRLALFDTRLSTEVELTVNVAVRYSDTEFEVPHATLVGESEFLHWEREIIGWLSNPLAGEPDFSQSADCPASSAEG